MWHACGVGAMGIGIDFLREVTVLVMNIVSF